MPDLRRNILFLLFLLPVSLMAQRAVPVHADTVTTVPETFGPIPFNPVEKATAVRVRSIPKKLADSLRAAADFWYANATPQPKKKPEAKARQGKSLLRQPWFQNLLWLLVLSSFMGVVLWYLYASKLLLFRRRPKIIGVAEEDLDEADNIFARQYEFEISAAEKEKNFRLAVRLWYLRSLKELASRQLITYSEGHTNSQYVSQLLNSAYYTDFYRLTRHFEYTWYGEFTLSADAYQQMRTDFSVFLNRLCT